MKIAKITLVLLALTLAGCASMPQHESRRDTALAYYCPPGSALRRLVPPGRNYPQWMLWRGAGTCKHR